MSEELFKPLSVSPDEMTVACSCCGKPIRYVPRKLKLDDGRRITVWVRANSSTISADRE